MTKRIFTEEQKLRRDITAKKWRKDNIEKDRENQRKLTKKNPDKIKAYKLKWLYGLHFDTFKTIESFQGGKCKICKQEAKLVVDHNHATGFVRALLCASCNNGLGFFRDKPELLESAAEYLRTHKPID